MDVVAGLPADPQAAEPVQVGERTLHGPALGAQSGAVLGAASGDHRLHAEGPDEAVVLVVVVATVTEHGVRAAPGPATLAAHWWNGFEQRDELGDVAAVAAGQGDGNGIPEANKSATNNANVARTRLTSCKPTHDLRQQRFDQRPKFVIDVPRRAAIAWTDLRRPSSMSPRR